MSLLSTARFQIIKFAKTNSRNAIVFGLYYTIRFNHKIIYIKLMEYEKNMLILHTEMLRLYFQTKRKQKYHNISGI